MVKSTQERQTELRQRREKLGQKRRELFLTDAEYARVKEYLVHLRSSVQIMGQIAKSDAKKALRRGKPLIAQPLLTGTDRTLRPKRK